MEKEISKDDSEEMRTASRLALTAQVNTQLKLLFPLIFESTLASLVNLLKDLAVRDISLTPCQQFVQQQFVFTIYELAKYVRKKIVNRSDIRDYMENLFGLYERIQSVDPLAVAHLSKLYCRLTNALSYLSTYIERATSKGNVTDWSMVVLCFQVNDEEIGKQRNLLLNLPSLKYLTVDRLMAVGETASVSKATFGNIECVLRFQPLPDDLLKRTLVAEREAASILNSPLVCKIYACFSTQMAYVTAMEYIRGVSAYKVLVKAKKFEDDILRVVISQVGYAIDYLHSCGVVHRDINPSSILMMQGCRIKIINLQNARICLGKYSTKVVGSCDDRAVELHGDDEFNGNPYYAAPEIFKKGNIHGRGVDWWSLGVTCFHLATGRNPFSHLRVADLKKKVLDNEVTWPKFRTPSWPLQKFVSKCIKAPKKRMCRYSNNEFFSHSFLEGLDWNSVASYRINIKDFAPLTQAFDKPEGTDLTNCSPPVSANLAARRNEMFGVEEALTHKKKPTVLSLYEESTIIQRGLFSFQSYAYLKVFDQMENNVFPEKMPEWPTVSPKLPATHTKYKFEEYYVTCGEPEVVFVLRRKRFLLSWETFGFDVVQYINQNGEPTITVSHVHSGSSAERAGLIFGDLLMAIGRSSFWCSRSLTKDDYKESIRTAKHKLFLKISSANPWRILRERVTSVNEIKAKTHEIWIQPLRNQTSTAVDFGLHIEILRLANGRCIIVRDVNPNILLAADEANLGIFIGDIITKVNDRDLTTDDIRSPQTAFQGYNTSLLVPVTVIPTSAIRIEQCWVLWGSYCEDLGLVKCKGPQASPQESTDVEQSIEEVEIWKDLSVES